MSSRESIKKIFLTSGPIDQAYSRVHEVLQGTGLRNLKIKKSVTNSYIIFEYKESFTKKGEIQFNFFARNDNTEFWINWNYPSIEDNQSEDDNKEDLEFGDGAEVLDIVTSIFSAIKSRRKSSSINYVQLIEEIRFKMGAKELRSSQIKEEVQFQT